MNVTVRHTAELGLLVLISVAVVFVCWPGVVYGAARWLYFVARGWCRPHCHLGHCDRLQNAGGLFFPMRYKCRTCGREFRL